MTIRLYHPGIDGHADAVDQAQADHLATLGWIPAPDPGDDAPAETHVEEFDGTVSSLGADITISDSPVDAAHVDPDPPELGEED